MRKIAASLLSVLIWICASSFLNAAQPKPNVIIIYTDDMGYGDLGCNGGKIVPTPNIDKLAKEGTRFTQFYVPSPICSPSRTGLLTGMYPSRWKIHTFLHSRAGNRAAGQDDFLNPNAPSMPRAFKQAGYVTAHIGKWHLGGGRDVTNAPKFAAYGYDEHVSTYESPEPDPNLTATKWIWSDQDSVKRWDRTAYFVDKTLDFLKRNGDQPCFVNLWPDDVHTPWVPKGAPTQRGKRQHESLEEFKQVLAEYDRQIGRLLAGLENLGLEENTIVIFASDNGPSRDFAGDPRTLGLRGKKATLFEGGIRMPFIVRWPGKTPTNRVDNTSVINSVDLFPTLCKMANVPPPQNASFDGQDMSGALLGQSTDRKTPMFWDFSRGRGDEENDGTSPNLAVRDGKWKLLVNGNGSGAQLYDLVSDPKEKTDLSKTHPAETKRLTAMVRKWKASVKQTR